MTITNLMSRLIPLVLAGIMVSCSSPTIEVVAGESTDTPGHDPSMASEDEYAAGCWGEAESDIDPDLEGPRSAEGAFSAQQEAAAGAASRHVPSASEPRGRNFEAESRAIQELLDSATPDNRFNTDARHAWTTQTPEGITGLVVAERGADDSWQVTLLRYRLPTEMCQP